MVLSEVIIRVEQELVGSEPRVTVAVKGIAHPMGVVKLCNVAIGTAIEQIEQAAVQAQMAEALAMNGVQTH